MIRWIAAWWEWLRDGVRNEDDEAYPTYHDYPDEAKSPEWIARRKRWVREWFTVKSYAPTCLVCHRDWTLADDLHHVTYLHLGEELFTDLLPLCHDDHVKMHELFERDPSYLRAGRLQATTVVIRQLRERRSKESVQRLIAESEDQ
ncbi:MAG: hypothetical protein ACYDEH_12330 [Acidimicrobiales bacterium]